MTEPSLAVAGLAGLIGYDYCALLGYETPVPGLPDLILPWFKRATGLLDEADFGEVDSKSALKLRPSSTCSSVPLTSMVTG